MKSKVFVLLGGITDPVLYFVYIQLLLGKKYYGLCPWVTPATKFKAITWTKPRSHDFVKLKQPENIGCHIVPSWLQTMITNLHLDMG